MLTPDMAIVDSELRVGPAGRPHRRLGLRRAHPRRGGPGCGLRHGHTATPWPWSRRAWYRIPAPRVPRRRRHRGPRKMHDAAAMAGMAFANAMLGLCHYHGPQARRGVPHPARDGDALLLDKVVRYNAVEAPTRQAAFYPVRSSHGRGALRPAGRLPGPRGKRRRKPRFELLVKKIAELRKEVGLPATIREAGVDDGSVPGRPGDDLRARLR
jgi:acetaldehyde dehydrogenase/alcohol dehydrogenase